MDPLGEILLSVLARARPDAELPVLLCEEAAATLPVTGAALVAMTPEGAQTMVAVVGAVAARLEEVQFVTGEGPCVDAFTTGRLVLAGDLARQPSWPAFAPMALAAGVRAVFAFPVQIGGIRLGVLELHRDEAGGLDDAVLTRCLHFADAAILVLMHVGGAVSWDARSIDTGTVARPEVHQATGMVSVHADVPLAEALVLLRARAFATGRPILELARDVLDGRAHFSSTDGAGPG